MALAACALLAACDASDGPATTTSPTATVTQPDEAARRYADPEPTFDGQLNAVSLAHPGFKGIVGSADGSEVIILASSDVLAASGKAGSLVADLANRFGIQPAQLSFGEATVAARSASAASTLPLDSRPDFHDLYAVKTALRRLLLETDLVSGLDIDETTGRVRVDVEEGANIARARALMTSDELDQVDFEVVGRAVGFHGADPSTVGAPSAEMHSASMPSRSLRNDRFTPFVAGPEINFGVRAPDGTEPSCTVGPIVRYNNSLYGFLTNSHCTPSRSSVLSEYPFYQPAIGTTNVVGRETAEQMQRTLPLFPNGYFADVAFVRTPNGVGLKGEMVGSVNCTLDPLSPCTEAGPPDQISGVRQYLTVNAQVYKAGRTTGTSGGYVSQTCYDAMIDNVRTLCSNIVRRSPYFPSSEPLAWYGDSGSAVQLTLAPLPQREVDGILFGGRPETDIQMFFYSPWENIAKAGSGLMSIYGLPVSVLTASQGIVSNTSGGGSTTGGGGGGPTGGGGGGGCPGGLEQAYDDQPPCQP